MPTPLWPTNTQSSGQRLAQRFHAVSTPALHGSTGMPSERYGCGARAVRAVPASSRRSVLLTTSTGRAPDCSTATRYRSISRGCSGGASVATTTTTTSMLAAMARRRCGTCGRRGEQAVAGQNRDDAMGLARLFHEHVIADGEWLCCRPASCGGSAAATSSPGGSSSRTRQVPAAIPVTTPRSTVSRPRGRPHSARRSRVGFTAWPPRDPRRPTRAGSPRARAAGLRASAS